ILESLPDEETARVVVLVLQRDPGQADPAVTDLHPVGTLARVLHRSRRHKDGGGYVFIAAGLQRVRLVEETGHEPFLKARVELLEDRAPAEPDPAYLALRDTLRSLFSAYVEKSPNLSNDIVGLVADVEDAA